MRTRATELTAAAVLSIALAACGGSGHDDTPATNTVQGLWIGSSTDGTTNQDGTPAVRKTVGLVLDNGTIFELYGIPGDGTLGIISGFLQGTVKTDDKGNLTSNDLVDYRADLLAPSTSFVAATLTPALQGSYIEHTSLSGVLTYPTVNTRTVSFTSAYDKGYETKADLTVIANPGEWDGVVSTMIVNTTDSIANPSATGELAAGSIKIGADGALSILTTACTASGTVKPHAVGNVYDVSATFSNQCPFSEHALSGVAYFSISNGGRTVYVALTTNDRKSAIAFTGTAVTLRP
ncbi:hypothetical protein [Caballeronia sordidicola]|uniref:hypothetical protein n=1 Tax=Caballeronia sordidicola TaxID=196367 RepID=UPI00094CB098|nr:hypothetical protein [Caballeronia sordidicola]